MKDRILENNFTWIPLKEGIKQTPSESLTDSAASDDSDGSLIIPKIYKI